MIYVGVDLHLRFCYMTVLDANGKVLRQGRVQNTDSQLQQFFADIKNSLSEKEGLAVAVEACGFWCAFVDCIEPLVERVVLVHPAKVKAIAHAKLKNDRVDSATLAQLLRANLLPEAWKADRTTRIPHDAEMYKWRHLIENFFCRLKAFRRVATRYEKTDACFAGLINLVAAFLAIR